MKLIWATAAEAAAMAQAHAGAFEAPWREEDFEDLLDGEGVFGFLADDPAGGPTGVILCRVAVDEVEVLTLGVARPVRRKGVARQAGARACFLEVAVDNDAAAALYAGLGFRRSGVRKRYYDRGAAGQVDALVMRRDLNDAPA
jgi:ribosomal-protein-alanine N-acetyltransferase